MYVSVSVVNTGFWLRVSGLIDMEAISCNTVHVFYLKMIVFKSFT